MQSEKLGRNDPCWCGSGKKFKKCHLDRQDLPPFTVSEVLQRQKKTFDKRYCMHPNSGKNCSGDIVRAHTIQKAGGLDHIARNGHVYQFNPDFLTVRKNDGEVTEKLIGINQASTFTGFCERHDNETFAPIEKRSFQPCQQHAFLLGYRALCHEVFWRRIFRESLDQARDGDRGTKLDDQVSLQGSLQSLTRGVDASVKTVEHYKKVYDNILLTGDFSSVQYFTVLLENVPDVMVCGTTFPEYDFEGQLLQDRNNLSRIFDVVTFSSISLDHGGAVVLAWTKDSNESCGKLVASLSRISKARLCDALVRFLFTYLSNVFFSPSWWENLAKDAQDNIRMRVHIGLYPSLLPGPNCLVEDGVEFVRWKISRIESNAI